MPRIHKTKFELHEWKAKPCDHAVAVGGEYLYTRNKIDEGYGNIVAYAGNLYNNFIDSDPISYTAKQFLEDYEHVRAFKLQDQ